MDFAEWIGAHSSAYYALVEYMREHKYTPEDVLNILIDRDAHYEDARSEEEEQ